jgi:hypothetical protein
MTEEVFRPHLAALRKSEEALKEQQARTIAQNNNERRANEPPPGWISPEEDAQQRASGDFTSDPLLDPILVGLSKPGVECTEVLDIMTDLLKLVGERPTHAALVNSPRLLSVLAKIFWQNALLCNQVPPLGVWPVTHRLVDELNIELRGRKRGRPVGSGVPKLAYNYWQPPVKNMSRNEA